MATWPNPVEAESHITMELSRSGLDWHSSGRNIKICCPNPHSKGKDTGYNLELTKDGRKAHCWVCDWSGSWNKLARLVGAEPFSKSFDINATPTFTDVAVQQDLFEILHHDISVDFESKTQSEISLPDQIDPWELGKWRGLTPDFLSSVPSFLWKQKVEMHDKTTNRVYKTFFVDRMLWPYQQFDRLVGYCGRRLDKSDFQKYYRNAKAKDVLFPFDYVRLNYPKTDSVVLVEGEVDALKLVQAGIPALAILGTNNWSDTKKDLLHALGVSNVFLLMDPDFAGKKATAYLTADLQDDFQLSALGLSDVDQDPGSLEPEQLLWLKKRVLGARS